MIHGDAQDSWPITQSVFLVVEPRRELARWASVAWKPHRNWIKANFNQSPGTGASSDNSMWRSPHNKSICYSFTKSRREREIRVAPINILKNALAWGTIRKLEKVICTGNRRGKCKFNCVKTTWLKLPNIRTMPNWIIVVETGCVHLMGVNTNRCSCLRSFAERLRYRRDRRKAKNLSKSLGEGFGARTLSEFLLNWNVSMKKGQIDDSRNPLKPCEISNLELFSRKA